MKIKNMSKQNKQRWKEYFTEESGDRTGIQAILFYTYILLGNLGIQFSVFFALIFTAWLSVVCHILSVQAVAEITGIVMVGWLYIMIAFSCTKTGNKFFVRVSDEIEKSIVNTLHALRVLPILPSLQGVKFIDINEASGSFISSAPFIPPRLCLA
ncbi:MAG: hypothetical protein WB870_11680 [Gallionellaceae bacterium]